MEHNKTVETNERKTIKFVYNFYGTAEKNWLTIQGCTMIAW